MENFKSFTNLYSLSKTLRFELRPVGATLQNIENSGLLTQDEHRAESYKKVKQIIDSYHTAFIDNALSHAQLKVNSTNNNDSLEEVYQYLTHRDHTEDENVAFKTTLDNLRKSVVKILKSNELFSRIFKKELIQQDLLRSDLLGYEINDEKKTLIQEFSSFTTYFTGFNENRANMYSEDAKSTAIGFRLIHENLPKFIDNMTVFQKVVQSPVSEYFVNIETDMESLLQGTSLTEIFSLKYYNNLLVQRYIDLYNAVVGGMTTETDNHIKGLNQYINEYNQKQTDKKCRLPKLKPLFKQILSDRVEISWRLDNFENDDEVLKAILNYYNELEEEVLNKEEGNLPSLLANITEYDLGGIYVSAKSITDISQHVFKNWNTIEDALQSACCRQNPPKKNEKPEKYADRIKKLLNQVESYSLGEIIEALAAYQKDPKSDILNYFQQMGSKDDKLSFVDNIHSDFVVVEELLKTEYPKNRNLAMDKSNISKIKSLLDNIKALQFFVKPLLGTGKESGKDERFYGELVGYWDTLDAITHLYNKVRNYATRKPYSTDKIQLYFENKGQFLGGWVDSKTEKSDNGTQAGGYLFRKKNSIGEYDYYLGISSDAKLFRMEEGVSGSFERLDYYQPKSQSVYGSSYAGENTYEEDKKRLLSVMNSFVETISDPSVRKSLKSKASKKEVTPSGLLSDIQNSGEQYYQELLGSNDFIKINRVVTKNLHKTILSLYRIPESKQYANKTFSLFTEPQEVIERLCSNRVFSYFPVSDQEMDEVQMRGTKKMYLFQIVNKDLTFAETFSKGLRKSRGTDNLHTMLFKQLMSGEQSVFDIGTGMVFWRKETKDLKKTPTHFKGEVLKNKNPLNPKKTSTMDYDLVKNRRYTMDKFLFHLSMNLNYNSLKPKQVPINDKVQDYIRKNPDLHFIGIDRGERHLLYITVIDSKGNIKEQFSMNEICNVHNGVEYRTNYHDLLEQRGDVRTEARREWLAIEGIKELKEGYLSQVVHRITDLMVKYNAIVVLEDLNIGFKRGRQKVESSAYQQFEHKLIDKLNYLASKTAPTTEPGGLLCAYQLAIPYSQEMGHQNGFVFYIPAWNTSKMDPVTGFTNLFNLHIDTMDQARKFFEKFDAIRYNKDKNWVEFDFDYSNFTEKAEGSRSQWTLCSQGSRIRTFRNPSKNSEWDDEELDLTSQFLKLFQDKGFDLHSDIRTQILTQTDRDFFMSLLQCMKLTLQMRNSKSGTDIDYLISPVADTEGNFFDSRYTDASLPANADANGAYNIARKGLWLARQIQASLPGEKIKLSISNKEWLQFAQEKPYK